MPFFKVKGICASLFVYVLDLGWDDDRILRTSKEKGYFLW